MYGGVRHQAVRRQAVRRQAVLTLERIMLVLSRKPGERLVYHKEGTEPIYLTVGPVSKGQVTLILRDQSYQLQMEGVLEVLPDVSVKIVGLRGDRVRLGTNGPRDVLVDREEVYVKYRLKVA